MNKIASRSFLPGIIALVLALFFSLSLMPPLLAHADSPGSNPTNGPGSSPVNFPGSNPGDSPGGNPTTGGLTNPLGSTSDIPTLINAILTFIITTIAPAIITLMLVYCGFLFVTAQGNAEKISTARTALLWTVIGALILLGAVAIEGIIKTTVGGL